MLEKFKKSSSDRIINWVKSAVDILNNRGIVTKLVIKGQ